MTNLVPVPAAPGTIVDLDLTSFIRIQDRASAGTVTFVTSAGTADIAVAVVENDGRFVVELELSNGTRLVWDVCDERGVADEVAEGLAHRASWTGYLGVRKRRYERFSDPY